MRKIKQIFPLSIFALVFIFTSGISANASNDQWPYNFKIKQGYENTYSDKRYRQTDDTSNKWKVNLLHSDEGKGTVTTFWLALFNSSHDVVSNTHDVTEGSGDHYYNAWSSASRKNVCLGAENNNYSDSSYFVYGYWDEETN